MALNHLRGEDLRDASGLPRTGPQYLKPLTARPGGHLSLIPSLPNAEGGTADAIYARPESPACNAEAQKVGFEIAHIHPVGNSLHMLLSPADACTIVEASWGRRFPDPTSVPSGWIMVYAPRDLEEVELVQCMVEAAVRWKLKDI
ncbi:hypothetical protein N7451_012322 [Penicillium sp. IBT 35674x]|nr:hypothetical protein N7451_012322 [Penicillium sp. IBT 35674x]